MDGTSVGVRVVVLVVLRLVVRVGGRLSCGVGPGRSRL